MFEPPRKRRKLLKRGRGGGGGGGVKKEKKKREKKPVKKLLCFTGQQSQIHKMNHRFGVQSVLAITMKTFSRSK